MTEATEQTAPVAPIIPPQVRKTPVITITIPEDVLAQVEVTAGAEQRTRANMCSILIREALTARAEKVAAMVKELRKPKKGNKRK